MMAAGDQRRDYYANGGRVSMNYSTLRPSLRLPATLLLGGQLLNIVVALFHTGGEANNHAAIFAACAGSSIWTAVHVGQFACMATLFVGLLCLSFALQAHPCTMR